MSGSKFSDSSPTYAVVDKRKKKKVKISRGAEGEVSDLYAVVDKSKKKFVSKYPNNKEENEVHSVVDENTQDIELFHISSHDTQSIPQHSSDTEDKSLPSHSGFKRKSASSLNSENVLSLNLKKDSKILKVSFPQLIWLITIVVMTIIIIVLIATTVVGFMKVSMLESELSLERMNFLENNCTFNVSQHESLINLTSINQLFTGSIYSHLQNFFIAKKTLLLLLNDCIERVGSKFFSMCVDSALNIYGKHVILPAQSCRELQIIRPNNSDYYLVSASDGSIVQVYCDMTKSCGNITGGLTRVASINSTSYSQHCSSMDLMYDNIGCVRESALPGCSGIIFSTMHLPYFHICGIVDGRYFGPIDGFSGSNRSANTTINDNYVDGISFTYGNTSHRTHIWTFSATASNCSINVPEYVGVHHSCLNSTYFCRTGDCDLTFQRDFITSLTENIEVRLCQDQHRDPDGEGVYLTYLDLYVY